MYARSIAAVAEETDNVESHVNDTLIAVPVYVIKPLLNLLKMPKNRHFGSFSHKAYTF